MCEPLYKIIARTMKAYHNCLERDSNYAAKHEALLEWIERNLLPSGSGFDSGTKVSRDYSGPNGEFELSTEFHHMNDGGYYDGWTSHTIRVKPHLSLDFCLVIKGRDRNQIKEYMTDVFNEVLSREYESVFDDELDHVVLKEEK